ncbi:MAG: Gfo/Idh/MocA family oxidoreductase [Deltaproteobacteria bacterium]|nr:Gfo/Idh/MocA family oxidoreductase [Deltaproteobacteria bacterium]
MKQIIQSYKNGKISLSDVPEPVCKAGGVLVQTKASLISPGTEKLMIEMGQKSLLGKARARPDLVRQAWAKAQKEGFVSVFKEAMNRLDEPLPLGYSAAGVVMEVGAGVQDFRPGDRVAAAGAGFASHAEVVWVPENLCVPIPEGVGFEEAAFVMLGGIALHGVRQAALTLGETGVVIGLGLLGLLSVQFLAAQGCRVIGVDLDRQKCDLAREVGADLALVPGQDDAAEAVANLTRGRGADAVLITAASSDPRPVRLAEELGRERARLVLVGVAELSLTRKAFWEKELLFTVSKAAGPGSLEPLYEAKGFDYPISLVRWTERRNLAAFLDLVARGRVQLEKLITHRFPIDQALEAYELILKNREPYIGVLLNYPQSARDGREAPSPPPRPSPLKGEGVNKSTSPHKVWLRPADSPSQPAKPQAIGLIGGGMFTKNILLPALKKVPELHLAGAATTTGVTAQHLAKKFGFAYATTDYREILQDQAIGSVIITTRHNSHASLVLEALAAGKHVFVEKPLCLSVEELEEISAAFDGSRLLMVGFNRRFAPLAQQVKAMVAGRTTPLMMTYRVNAGYIPADHWVHDPEAGGGRLLGEVCHFIDFLHYMSGSEASAVRVANIAGAAGKYRPDDNLSITLTFKDGSVGAILYTAKGPKAFSRERFEVFCEDSAAVIEDFRQAQIIQSGRRRKISKFSMDMGYQAELEFFAKAVADPSIFHRLFEEYAASTQATLKAAANLKSKIPD